MIYGVEFIFGNQIRPREKFNGEYLAKISNDSPGGNHFSPQVRFLIETIPLCD